MDKLAMTQAIMVAKEDKALSWEAISKVAGMSVEFTTSACLGMNSLPEDAANKLCAFLALSTDVSIALQKFPLKVWDQTVPTDPLIYRFYEIMGVYGPTLKEVIQEKCGDGIMSAIDFTLTVDKKEDPKGDRIVVTMDGKFLAYKGW